jgi:hypothetical protein
MEIKRLTTVTYRTVNGRITEIISVKTTIVPPIKPLDYKKYQA